VDPTDVTSPASAVILPTVAEPETALSSLHPAYFALVFAGLVSGLVGRLVKRR
jgi:hypothetical protein